MQNIETNQGDPGMPGAALETALKILDRWQCTNAEIKVLLGIDDSMLDKFQQEPRSAVVGPDIIVRVSVVLNIHAALRELFIDPESVYGWVRKQNEHPLCAGRSAMDLMQQGRIKDLYRVKDLLYRELDGRI